MASRKVFAGYLLREIPLFLISTVTCILPDHPHFCRIRGFLARPFFKSCGRNFQFGRFVRFIRPGNLVIGNDVYIAEGSWVCGTGGCVLEDEVMLGPRCIVISTHHGRRNNSYRFAYGKMKAIHIGHGTWLGAHVTVTPGAHIGAGCLVGANSVVSGAIMPNQLVRPAAVSSVTIEASIDENSSL
ncbi:putative acetyltransferase [Planctomycetes bacterium CA13]|uniref:Putative acetyltransferase n=1 Tax=Novipirellula herctigrandis TaxID=2527986 RepID=A0A5C5YYG5_9BACT|nr:putative acetyltransferase [Planctomycetes bacterium CA13]